MNFARWMAWWYRQLYSDEWSIRASLRFWLPVAAFSVAAVVVSWYCGSLHSCVYVVGHVLLAIALVVEGCAASYTMLWFGLRKLFSGLSERSSQLLTRLLQSALGGQPVHLEPQQVDKYVDTHFDEANRLEVLGTLGTFVGIWLRMYATFTLFSVALVYWDFAGKGEQKVFGDKAYTDLRSFGGLLEIGLDSCYLNLVTMGTVGYGDRAPITPMARYMVSVQIFMNTLFLTFGINTLVGLVMENSVTSAEERRRLLKEHLRNALEQRRQFPGPAQSGC